MPRHVAVVFVHGIYNQEFDFAKPLLAALRKRLSDKQRYVQFANIEWAHSVLRDRQKDFMARVQAEYPDITQNKLRHFLLEGLGDAAAYHKTSRPQESSYRFIQRRITEKLEVLDQEPVKNRPLIFIGHSLGCHIISSYAWDLNKFKQRTEADLADESDPEMMALWKQLRDSPFRRLDTFAGFVTLGSNMPLFTFPFSPDRVHPITVAPPARDGRSFAAAFPGIGLEKTLFDQARWLNFFSKRDVLGFPLKPLYHAFDMKDRLEDVCVTSESSLSRFLPYWSSLSAHVRYWTNEKVVDRTATLIGGIVGE